MEKKLEESVISYNQGIVKSREMEEKLKELPISYDWGIGIIYEGESNYSGYCKGKLASKEKYNHKDELPILDPFDYEVLCVHIEIKENKKEIYEQVYTILKKLEGIDEMCVNHFTKPHSRILIRQNSDHHIINYGVVFEIYCHANCWFYQFVKNNKLIKPEKARDFF